MMYKNHPIFQLSPEITIFPVVHKSLIWTHFLKEFLLENNFDTIAVDLPEFTKPYVIEGIKRLPEITCVLYQDPEYDNIIIPIDPSEATIEAIKWAVEEDIPLYFVDSNILTLKYLHESYYPDPYSLNFIDNLEYLLTLIPKITEDFYTKEDIKRYKIISGKLFDLTLKYNKILFIVDILDFLKIKDIYRNFEFLSDFNFSPKEIGLYNIPEKYLHYITGEIPFIVYKYISQSLDIFSKESTYEEIIKYLLIKTRDDYLKKHKEKNISPQTLNHILKLARNYTLMNKRLFPDLITLIKSIRKVIDDDYFAFLFLKNARFYPFNRKTYSKETSIKILADLIQKPNKKSTEIFFNYFDTSPKEWVDLKFKIKKEKIEDYKFSYDDFHFYHIVSYPPEDIFLENYIKKIKETGKSLLREKHSRIEEFSSGLKDGIAIKEMLKEFYKENILIKEYDLRFYNVDIEGTIIFFDEDNDHFYPMKGILYAEHHNESTLGYYSTAFKRYQTHKGIFKAKYGGLFLIYPPKNIPDFWIILERNKEFKNYSLSEKLLYGLCYYTKSKFILYIAKKPPDERKKEIIKTFKKYYIYIPLSQIPKKALNRLQTFHILLDKNLRKIAHKYIRLGGEE